VKRSNILFIDDQQSARDLFLRVLDPHKYKPIVASGVAVAEEYLRHETADVVVTDLRMPDIDGLEGLARLHATDPDLPVVLITAFGTVETAVEAMKHGAFDYLRKPFDPAELEIVIDRALTHRQLLRENQRLRSEVARRAAPPDIICAAPAMASVMDLIARVAPSDFSVLMLGESGTGKDVFAKRLHQLSSRANQSFVSINCSAIPEHLLESELFGHEKGAFSGANQAREGFFAEADGGTLFLDEIGDMSLALQPKLLRVLQNGEYYRVGSRRLAKTDVRVVCASNRAIEDLVEHGQFRQDLYYRINTVRIELPPLRQRTADIPALAAHFLQRLAERHPRMPHAISAPAMALLLEYAWPGNVRELEHLIERASLVCDGEEIGVACLPREIRGSGTPGVASAAQVDRPYKDARREFEHSYFVHLLERSGNNVQRAADLAGLHRSTLYEKLAALGVAFEHEGAGK
jgi:DNA-binding NtrC family response regulator